MKNLLFTENYWLLKKGVAYNGLIRTTAYIGQRPIVYNGPVQRPIMDNGLLCTTAYCLQRPFLYNGPQKQDIGLFRTTASKTWDNGPMIQRPLKTSQRPLMYNGPKNMGQRPHDTTAPENFTTALYVQRP